MRRLSNMMRRIFSAEAKTAEPAAAAAAGPEGFSIKGMARDGQPAYLDLQATTPMDPRGRDAMMPWQMSEFGNPHSRTHSFGWDTDAAVEDAREKVASLIGADSREVVFTSGATESNNMAVKGVANFYGAKKKHVITTQVEHKCVLDSCRVIEQEGFDVTYLPVSSEGELDLTLLESSIREDTALVSIMAVNNEIGTVQDIAEIGRMCKAKKVLFHTDAAQMLGKMPIDVNAMGIDLMSMSSHKIYGPKGIGGLYVRRRAPRVRIAPIINGGGQERGLRSGTLPAPLCVGFGEACAVAGREMEADEAWVRYLSAKLMDGIEANIPDVTLNGPRENRYPGCLNYSFAYVEGESLLMALKELAISSGSACTSASLEPSYVLRALGVSDELAHTSMRFGIGRFTTEEEVDLAVHLLSKHVGRLREMSPLWELVQEGVDLSSIKWTQDHGHHH